ncbi:transposase family protein [Cardinium endosymbiont of Tipula unca]|uniref:transposase family protein n=1 Tax=Cardinium endosymbiont of Tipula unca TaxID=3066216 RepID=UPI0030D10E8D
MHLNYERLRKSPVTFQKMTGLDIEKFDELVILLSPSFAQIEAKKLRSGRNSRLPSVADKLLCGLVYYRTYITHTFLGYLFSLHSRS